MDLTKKTRAELLDMCTSINIKGKHKLKKMDIINLINNVSIKTSDSIIATDTIIATDSIIAPDPIIATDSIIAPDPIIATDTIIMPIKEDKINRMSKLITLFKFCLDVLRNKEHLTGDKALRNLAYMLNLCLLEPQLQSLNIDNMAFYPNFSEYGDDAESHSSRLLKLSRFSVLAKEKANNIPDIMKCLWDDVLCIHPITKNIFPPKRGFDIVDQSTYEKLIDKIASFDFTAFSEDILGEAYEEVIKDIMTGKVLGQFFTPPEVKEFMVDLIDPQIFPDGTIETIFDPAMGTGGFLITALRKLLKKKEPMNWDFIIRYGLGGREPEPDTYQLAVSNMLIASGKMFSSLEKGDSIRASITNKYDIILTNPPFGIDGLDYSEITCALRNSYIPIISSSAVPLFLQAVIYILKINGRCAMILPEGQELFSKNKALVAVREYLMKTCNLREIIYLPSGTFTHTSIKTCIFYFQKKKEGDEVVLLHAGKKESDRWYTFCPEHQTTIVEFYQRENGVKMLLGTVPIEDIAKNNYSLNYSEYIKKDDDVFSGDVNVMTLGEICTFMPKSKRKASEGISEGMYPFFKSSMKCNSYIDVADYNTESIIIGTGGVANIKHAVNFSCSADNYVMSIYSEKVLLKYIFYYLYHNLNILSIGFVGATIKHISKDYIAKIRIPIPSIAVQREAVAQLDFFYKCIKSSEDKIAELQQLNKFCISNQKNFGKNTHTKLGDVNVMTLGEICTLIKGPKRRSKDGSKTGKWPLFYCSILGNLYLDSYDYDGEGIILNKTNGSGKAMIYYSNDKYSVGESTIHFKTNSDFAITKYVYYYLLHNISIIETKFKGVLQKSITDKDFINIKIPIPSIAVQREAVEYCEYNDALILQLRKEIEQNKDIALKFLTQIINSGITNFECVDIEEHDGDESKDGDEEHDGDEDEYLE